MRTLAVIAWALLLAAARGSDDDDDDNGVRVLEPGAYARLSCLST